MIQLEIDVGNKLDFALSLSVQQMALMRGTNPAMYNLLKAARNEATRLYAGIRFHQAKIDNLELELKELNERITEWSMVL
jgi:hypothetical protein